MNYKLTNEVMEIGMATAVDEAEFALRHGNPPFGATLVSKNQITGRGSNKTITTGNPLDHAELLLLTETSHPIEGGSILFTTTEPCLMCYGAVLWAGVSKVVYATTQIELIGIRGYGFPLPPEPRIFDRLQILIADQYREKVAHLLQAYYKYKNPVNH
jgi:tRNA(Arg) A34 adenosine deaminase TadA